MNKLYRAIFILLFISLDPLAYAADTVGQPFFSNGNVFGVAIESVNSAYIYVAHNDEYCNNISVTRLNLNNLAAPVTENSGVACGISGRATQMSMVISNGNPYLAYLDENITSNNNLKVVAGANCDNNDPTLCTWNQIGSYSLAQALPPDRIYAISLTARPNGNLILAYYNGKGIGLLEYNRGNDNWQSLITANNGNQETGKVILQLVDNVAYVAYSKSGRITVLKQSNPADTSWTAVGVNWPDPWVYDNEIDFAVCHQHNPCIAYSRNRVWSPSYVGFVELLYPEINYWGYNNINDIPGTSTNNIAMTSGHNGEPYVITNNSFIYGRVLRPLGNNYVWFNSTYFNPDVKLGAYPIKIIISKYPNPLIFTSNGYVYWFFDNGSW